MGWEAFDVRNAESWPELLTPAQVAAVLQVQVPTIRAMLRDGRLASVRFGEKNLRVPKAGLLPTSDTHRELLS